MEEGEKEEIIIEWLPSLASWMEWRRRGRREGSWEEVMQPRRVSSTSHRDSFTCIATLQL